MTSHDKNQVYQRNMASHRSGKIKCQKLDANKLAKQYAQQRKDDMLKLIQLQESIRMEILEDRPTPNPQHFQSPERTGLYHRLQNYLCDSGRKPIMSPPQVTLQLTMMHQNIINDARHKQKVDNLIQQITNIQLGHHRKCHELETVIKQLEQENKSLKSSSLQLRQSMDRHLRDSQNQRTIEQQRTKSLIQNAIQKNQTYAKQLAHLIQQINSKNQVIEKLTSESLEKDRQMQQNTAVYELRLKQSSETSQTELQLKNKQFLQDQEKLQAQMAQAKQQKLTLSERCQALQNTINTQVQQNRILSERLVRVQEQLSRQKEKLQEVTDQHTKDIQRMMEERNTQSDNLNKSNNQGSIIRKYDETIEEIKKSHNRELDLLQQDIQNLKAKLAEKQVEMRDVVLKYDPLLQTMSRQEDGEKVSKADLELLRLLTDKYRSPSIPSI